MVKHRVVVFFPLYLGTWEAASRCHSPDTCSVRRPPWRSRQNTSTRPHPRTGRLPPGPPHWPRGGAVRRRLLHSSPDWRRQRLLPSPGLISPLTSYIHWSTSWLTDHFVIFCIRSEFSESEELALLSCVFLSLVQSSLKLCETYASLHHNCTNIFNLLLPEKCSEKNWWVSDCWMKKIISWNKVVLVRMNKPVCDVSLWFNTCKKTRRV